MHRLNGHSTMPDVSILQLSPPLRRLEVALRAILIEGLVRFQNTPSEYYTLNKLACVSEENDDGTSYLRFDGLVKAAGQKDDIPVRLAIAVKIGPDF